MNDRIVGEVLAEVRRATRKFPTWPTDPLHALAVLGEEFGELTKDVLQLTYEPQKTSRENVRTEAIQTAALALRFAASLDAYEYQRGSQHAQEAGAFGVLACDAPSPTAARCEGQEWDPFGVQPQCLGCQRYSSASMELSPQSVDWIEAPAGDPCPQHVPRTLCRHSPAVGRLLP